MLDAELLPIPLEEPENVFVGLKDVDPLLDADDVHESLGDLVSEDVGVRLPLGDRV